MAVWVMLRPTARSLTMLAFWQLATEIKVVISEKMTVFKPRFRAGS